MSVTTAFQREERSGNVSDRPTPQHTVATMSTGNIGAVWLTRDGAERIIRSVASEPDLVLAALDAGHVVNGPVAWYWTGPAVRQDRPLQQPWQGTSPKWQP